MIERKEYYDVLPIGRSSIDLYSNDIGQPFHLITSFNAYVGGSSTNIAVGCARLGLKTALFTAVGKDKVGEFIMHFLKNERVDTQFIPEKKDYRSSAVLLGIEPPDRFPLVYYRERAADLQLELADLERLKDAFFKFVVLSGTALSKEPSRSTVTRGIQYHGNRGSHILLDLDYRHDQWSSLNEYQQVVTTVLPEVQTILGTHEEVIASADPLADVMIRDQQISAPQIIGRLEWAISKLFDNGINRLILKSGESGAFIYDEPENPIHVPGYAVEVTNVLGAGDAFAAGYLHGQVHSWEPVKSVRFANACGAILVTKHGCSNFNPIQEEVMAFVKNRGGL